MQGSWSGLYAGSEAFKPGCLVSCSFTLSGSYLTAGGWYGVNIDTLSEEHRQQVIEDGAYREYDGQRYFFGMGDSGELVSVTEENRTVVIVDTKGSVVTFKRTGEKTLTVISTAWAEGADTDVVIPILPLGMVLYFG